MIHLHFKEGKVDYEKETVELVFNMIIKPTSGFKVIQNVLDGLIATNKRNEWGLINWPFSSDVFLDSEFNEYFIATTLKRPIVEKITSHYDRFHNSIQGKKITVAAILKNEYGKKIGEMNHDFFQCVGFNRTPNSRKIENTRRDKIVFDYAEQESKNSPYFRGHQYEDYLDYRKQVSFTNVDVNNITDNLLIEIVKINGVDATAASENGYIKISTDNL
jgi:hypothetical protein